MENKNWFKQVPESKCIVCNYTLNAVVEIEAEETALPDEGDLTMCIRCYTPMCFNKDLTIRLMTDEEKLEFEDLIMEMVNDIAFIKRNFSKAQGE